MPRYIVESRMPTGWQIFRSDDAADAIAAFAPHSATRAVYWRTGFVSQDFERCFCVVDGPSPDVVRQFAAEHHLRVEAVTQVSVVQPHGQGA